MYVLLDNTAWDMWRKILYVSGVQNYPTGNQTDKPTDQQYRPTHGEREEQKTINSELWAYIHLLHVRSGDL